MKNNTIAAFLAALMTMMAVAQNASAQSLYELESACRTGDLAACSRYNTAVIARNGGQQPVLQQGYDPFAIAPATHSERAPKPAVDPMTTDVGDVAVVTVGQ